MLSEASNNPGARTMPDKTTTLYTAQNFEEALRALDRRIGESKNLRKMAPIKMISAGGFVAVSCFGNRDATEDVDYILDPHIGNLQKAEEKLGAAIKDVTNQLGLADKWINDSMWVYSIGEPRKRLFKESIEQDQKLFSGRNLVIYAAKWQWALNRKLIRLSGDNPRERDLSDAVELIKRIIDASGRPLSRDLIKSWPTNSVDVIRDSVLDELATHFVAKFGTSPLL